MREAQEYWSEQPTPPGDLPDPGVELGSPAVQMDSLPTELSGKPRKVILLKPFFNCFHRYFSRNYDVYSFPVVLQNVFINATITI